MIPPLLAIFYLRRVVSTHVEKKKNKKCRFSNVTSSWLGETIQLREGDYEFCRLNSSPLAGTNHLHGSYRHSPFVRSTLWQPPDCLACREDYFLSSRQPTTPIRICGILVFHSQSQSNRKQSNNIMTIQSSRIPIGFHFWWLQRKSVQNFARDFYVSPLFGIPNTLSKREGDYFTLERGTVL